MTNYAVWNGTAWSAAGDLNGAGVRAISTGANLLVGGTFTVAGGVWMIDRVWYRESMERLRNARPVETDLATATILSSITALANDGTNLYAAGNFNYAGTTNANFIARFDGRNWQPVGAGLNNQVVALARHQTVTFMPAAISRALPTASFFVLHWMVGRYELEFVGQCRRCCLRLGHQQQLALCGRDRLQRRFIYSEPYFNRWDGTNWQNAIHFIPAGNTFFDLPTNDHDFFRILCHCDPEHQRLSGRQYPAFLPIRSRSPPAFPRSPIA